MGSDENLPDADLTALGQAAAQTVELFQELVKRGFTVEQALYLTASLLTKNPGRPPKGL